MPAKMPGWTALLVAAVFLLAKALALDVELDGCHAFATRMRMRRSARTCARRADAVAVDPRGCQRADILGLSSRARSSGLCLPGTGDHCAENQRSRGHRPVSSSPFRSAPERSSSPSEIGRGTSVLDEAPGTFVPAVCGAGSNDSPDCP